MLESDPSYEGSLIDGGTVKAERGRGSSSSPDKMDTTESLEPPPPCCLPGLTVLRPCGLGGVPGGSMSAVASVTRMDVSSRKVLEEHRYFMTEEYPRESSLGFTPQFKVEFMRRLSGVVQRDPPELCHDVRWGRSFWVLPGSAQAEDGEICMADAVIGEKVMSSYHMAFPYLMEDVWEEVEVCCEEWLREAAENQVCRQFGPMDSPARRFGAQVKVVLQVWRLGRSVRKYCSIVTYNNGQETPPLC